MIFFFSVTFCAKIGSYLLRVASDLTDNQLASCFLLVVS